ncbi:MAG: hypothetical protein HY786_04095 [Deltaproteobacteria bacterium]|nr:hypothetical protein [Deltaproteobacteria bacterium]
MHSRKTGILVVLLFVLAAVVVYRVVTREEPKKVRELTYKPVAGGQGPVVGRRGPVSKIKKTEEETAKTIPSKVEKRGYRGLIRNPFQALYPPVVIPKQAPPPPPPAPAPVISEPKGPSPAQTESGRFRFLGFLQKEGESKVFLSRDKEVFIVKKGDSVTIFQVADITDNSVTLQSRDSKEEFKLIIEDVKPGKPELMSGSGRR